MTSCYLCGDEKECRPYGPKGEWACFDCAFSTPEHKRETEQAYLAQLRAVGPEVVIGEETGPRPLARGGTQS